MTNTPRTDEQALYDFRAYVRQITGAYYPQLETLVETILKERPLPHTPSSDWEREILSKYFVSRLGGDHVGAQDELIADIRTHIENARREERERIIAKIENDPQIPIPRPYEVAWILTKLQLHDVTNKE